DGEAGHDGERQPEVPPIEVDDGDRSEDERRHVGERHQRVQPRPLLVQQAQLLGRNLAGEIPLELAGVIVVISHRTMKRVYTIGHSTRALEELVALLREHGIERLADIRRFPGSRRYPHFSREALERSLPERGIEYVHVPEHGERRKPAGDAPNTALRNEQFRAYADHMATAEAREAIERLLEFEGRTVVMCAEAVPWR